MLKFLLASLAALCALLVLFSGQVTPVPIASAHQPLCTQTGFVEQLCSVTMNGKRYTQLINFTAPLDYPNDTFLQSPTCDCFTMPPLGPTICSPRHRAPHPEDLLPWPTTYPSYRRLYCGPYVEGSTIPHLHVRP